MHVFGKPTCSNTNLAFSSSLVFHSFLFTCSRRITSLEQNNQIRPQSKGKKLVALFIKILVTIVCFWYISGKIDFSEALLSIKNANWFFLFLAVILYVLSKIVATYRLNLYFQNIDLCLPFLPSLKLYWLGMFYNLFLPGSISGDAYKVIVLNKRLQTPLKKGSAAVLLDRFSGLLGLGAILTVYGILVLDDLWLDFALVAGCLMAIGGLYWFVKKWFQEFIVSFFPTFFWGIVVQAIQVTGVYLILSALHIDAQLQQWIFIFLSASVISVLPISLGGGLGTRELVFIEGSAFFGLDPHLGVIISLLFYLSSVAGSIAGGYFIFIDPLKGIKKPEGQPIATVTNS